MIPLYLPEHKKKKLDKLGKLIDAASGLAFLGKFFQNHLGQFFKGDRLDENSEPLIFIPDEKEEDARELFDRFPVPTDKQYAKGISKRYFVKDIPSGKVVELDKNNYFKQKREGKPYRKFFSLDWNITGNLEDQTINGFAAEGLKSKNQKVIEDAAKQLPGIENVLKPDQLAQQSIAESEADRLGAQSITGLETKPDQFVIAGTGVKYNGPYHIHPTMGPMVGARHTAAEHPKLVFVGSKEDMPREVLNQQQYAETKSVVASGNQYTGGTLVRS